MRLSLLLPFLGSVWAAPTEPPSDSFPSIFDNPTIPTVDPADLGIPDDLPLFRRAAATTQNKVQLNVSRCTVRVEGGGGWRFKPETYNGVLWIVQGIPSPGTKNGQNPYDLYLDAGIPTASASRGGFIQFVTNAYLRTFPMIGKSLDDYAKVTTPSDGWIRANIDVSNVPIQDQPNRFSEQLVDSRGVVGPVTLFYPTTAYVSVLVADKGDVTGGAWLTGWPVPAPGVENLPGIYYAKITGFCIKTSGQWPLPSS
ncbi:hypothetical protein MRS44_011435 [Fusarium solani]|uniref:uncharacterized protein n=1 Tax=Fusarium solani TaxID=169388 RepID=UPI0032C3E96B|nr:hypothetical protein MRS44_011435 [Fusarium solani]